MSWYQQQGSKLIINVVVQAGSKHDCIIGIIENRLKIKLSSQAIEGKANQKLLQFLGKLFEVPKTWIQIKSGEKTPFKRVEIENSKVNPDFLVENSDPPPTK